jgi:hypothetical protein
MPKPPLSFLERLAIPKCKIVPQRRHDIVIDPEVRKLMSTQQLKKSNIRNINEMNEIVKQVTMETLSLTAFCTRMSNLLIETLQIANEEFNDDT